MAAGCSTWAFVCLLVALLGAFCQGQQELTVTMLEGSPITAKRGSEVTLSCKLNQGLQIILSNAIEWVKESRVPGLTNETMPLTRQETLTVSDPQKALRYSVEFRMPPDPVVVSLRIKDVESGDDGRYVCRVSSIQKAKVIASGFVDVIVPNEAERVMMKVDGMMAGVTTRVTVGSHTVHCTTEGGNPPGEQFTLELGSQPLSTQVNASLMTAASNVSGAPRYRVQAEAKMDVTGADNGKALTCTAQNAPTDVTTKLIVIPKPTVDCDDVKVLRSEMQARLVCLVTHVDVTVDDFVWELNDSGIVYSTEDSSDHKPSKTEMLSDSETRVSLRVDAESWGDARHHFKLTAVTEFGDFSDEAYLIVVEDDGDDDDDDDGKGGDDDDKDTTTGDDKNGSSDDNSNGASGSRTAVKTLWNVVLLVMVLSVSLQE